MKKPKHIVVGVTTLFMLAGWGNMSASDAADLTDNCKDQITMSATQKPKSKALEAAIEKWELDVAAKHGAEFSFWKKSKNKVKRCTGVDGSFLNKTYTCVITANPCLT